MFEYIRNTFHVCDVKFGDFDSSPKCQTQFFETQTLQTDRITAFQVSEITAPNQFQITIVRKKLTFSIK